MNYQLLTVFTFIISLYFVSPLSAQLKQPPFTPAVERIKSFEQHKKLENNSIVDGIEFKSVGPSVFSGRVVDLDVWENDPSHFYVAYASSGLWKTENNGISFSPLFEQEMVMTIGDIAVDWDRNTIWLGSGENNSSRSSYAGVGIFKSTDSGKTWEHMGLGESHHIGRIIMHPTNPNIVWVAALGHLYSPNQERGIYKTTDGGKTWNKTLFVDDNSGAIDLVINPDNPNTLYAATWHRERRAWDFVEAGPGSGIYKSTDGGKTWSLLTDKNSGFPTGKGVGRIGLDLIQVKGKPVLYAALDNYFRRPKEEEEEEQLTKEDLRDMSKEDFLNLEKWMLKGYLSQYRFPEKYSVDKVIKMVKNDKIKPIALVEYVEDANSLLFDTPVIGLEVYRSDDEGKTWQKTHSDYIDNVYNSYGYYFGQIRVAQNNPKQLYVMGVPILRSDDGGENWKSVNGDNVHVDHHALWINPDRSGHLILGNDGGVNISYDFGESWIKCNTPPVGQFYAVAADMNKPYNVYGGLQDNGVWMGPSNYEASTDWHSSGEYPYKSLLGGDGMQVQIDTRDNATVYTGFQFGNYFRINTNNDQRKFITPKPELGERPLRWNWQSPIHLSVHNQDILYMGSNKVHRSFNQGDDFEEISGDLTTGGIKGDVAFSTLTTIHESPLKFGLLYVGSDDGLVHLSKDGGNTWTNITVGLPEDLWISRVQASAVVKGRVYVALNGYRWDDFRSLIYVSDNYGENWKRIGLDLPLEPVNVIKEDPENEDILYVGTDHGLYVSLDRGDSFMLMANGLPKVAVHDVVVHPREKDLIVGTHGRSIYIGSVKELQQINPELLAKTIHVFEAPSIRSSSRWGNNTVAWREIDPPEVKLPIYTKNEGTVKVQIKTQGDLLLRTFETKVQRGLTSIKYDLMIDASILEAYNEELNKEVKKGEKPISIKPAKDGNTYIYKGKYKLSIEKDGQLEEGTLEVK